MGLGSIVLYNISIGNQTAVLTFHWHVFCICFCVTQLLFLLLLRLIFLFHPWGFLRNHRLCETHSSHNVLLLFSSNWPELYYVHVSLIITRGCEKFCILMPSLIQILAASFPNASFLIPLFISPETQTETRGVTEAAHRVHPSGWTKCMRRCPCRLCMYRLQHLQLWS